MTAPTADLTLLERILRPRNLIVVTATLCSSVMAAIAVTPVIDPDVWWVAAAGRETLGSRAVPRLNLFSFVDPLRPWVMHEWLFGPPYALALRSLGPSAFVAIALVAAALAMARVVAFTLARSRYTSVGMAAAFATVAFFGGRLVSARPPGVSLLFPMLLVPIAFAPRFRPTSLALTTVIELVWTNAHGSFPLGVALLAVAALDEAKDRVMRVAATIAAVLVTFVNPYGLALHRLAWGYFRGSDGIYREIHANIQEFGDIAHAWGRPVSPIEALGLALVAALAAWAAFRRPHRLRALFCLALLLQAILHVRQLQLSGIISCFLLLPFVDDLASRGLPPRWRTKALPLAPLLVLGPPYLIGALLFASLEVRRAPEQWIAEGPALVPLLEAVPDGARLLAPFDQAGLAIWYTFPRGVRVFYDSRNDCYSAETFRALRTLEIADPGTDVPAVLARTDTTAVLTRTDQSLEGALSRAPGWELSSRSGGWRLYRRGRERGP